MAEKKTRILLRSDILSNWTSYDPVLGKGEVAVVYDPSVTGERKIRLKVGDNVAKFSELPYIADYDSAIAGLVADIARLDGADTVDGSVAKKIKVAIDALSEEIAETYQEKLPEVTADKYNKYLHTNTTTGELEWVYVEQGAANWGSISGSIDAQTDLMAEFAKKVDVEEGKGLSTNDYTDEDKEKLADIEDGAQVNVIEEIQIDGVKVAPSNKSVNIVGLAKAADVSNLKDRVDALETAVSNTYTKAEVDTALALKADKTDVEAALALKADAEDVYTKLEVYTKTETETKIADAIAGIKHWTYKVVDELPTPSADCEHIIYLVPKGSGKTGYKEYVCINEGTTEQPNWKFEEIGDTDIDLSEYRKSADQDEIDNAIKARIAVFEAGGAQDVAALKTRVGAAETAIDALEEDAHTHDNKDELDLIATGDVAKWNAKQDAITVGDNLTFTNNKIELNFDVLDGGSASDWPEE